MSSPVEAITLDCDINALHADLKVAVRKCSERCLYHSAKWLAEHLNSFASKPTPELDMSNAPPSSDATIQFSQYPMDEEERRLELIEEDEYMLAKCFFDTREFDRAARVLVDCNSSKSKFLHYYSKLMAGEKRKDEESEMILGPLDGQKTQNNELVSLVAGLHKVIEVDNNDDPFLLYLYGTALYKQRNPTKAQEMLVQSVNRYPYNWAAWEELRACVNSVDELNHVLPRLPDHIMSKVFRLHVNQELYQHSEAMHAELTSMQDIFPKSLFLKTQRALLYYHAKDFDEAEVVFDSILNDDPHRLDALDHYSNILYVMERRPKLAFIAQVANSTDKFRPETCCVVGNYFSLKSEHEKAVMYFRRALNLDRSFLSAWTLMGHEYVEMKNTHAAIEAYRRAVDANRKDYRAWYGLGQTYEVLEMHFYALFYYQRAASLRPYDAQMWQAMGSCYDRMNRFEQAIKCFKRALISVSSSSSGVVPGSATATGGGGGGIPGQPQQGYDPTLLYNLGLMYDKIKMPKEAAAYMEMCLREEDETGVITSTSKARMWLARYEFANENWQRASQLAHELCQNGTEIEEAKALVRDLRSRMEHMKNLSDG